MSQAAGDSAPGEFPFRPSRSVRPPIAGAGSHEKIGLGRRRGKRGAGRWTWPIGESSALPRPRRALVSPPARCRAAAPGTARDRPAAEGSSRTRGAPRPCRRLARPAGLPGDSAAAAGGAGAEAARGAEGEGGVDAATEPPPNGSTSAAVRFWVELPALPCRPSGLPVGNDELGRRVGARAGIVNKACADHLMHSKPELEPGA